jgi:hypothetical protein
MREISDGKENEVINRLTEHVDHEEEQHDKAPS